MSVDAEYADRFCRQSWYVDFLAWRNLCTQCWLPWQHFCRRHKQMNMEISIKFILITLWCNLLHNRNISNICTSMLSPNFLSIHFASGFLENCDLFQIARLDTAGILHIPTGRLVARGLQPTCPICWWIDHSEDVTKLATAMFVLFVTVCELITFEFPNVLDSNL